MGKRLNQSLLGTLWDPLWDPSPIWEAPGPFWRPTGTTLGSLRRGIGDPKLPQNQKTCIQIDDKNIHSSLHHGNHSKQNSTVIRYEKCLSFTEARIGRELEFMRKPPPLGGEMGEFEGGWAL